MLMTPMLPLFEYAIESIARQAEEKTLQTTIEKKVAEGWELIGLAGHNGTSSYVFRRIVGYR